MENKELLTEELEQDIFWEPNNIEEVDWEEYDRIWESKWKFYN